MCHDFLHFNESARFSINTISGRNDYYDPVYRKFFKTTKRSTCKSTQKREAVKIVVSLLMAIIVVTLVFIAQQSDSMPTISTFYHDAYNLAGGKKYCEFNTR